ncbi:unnamed protein product, partial [Brachionus calyciflorus]
AIFRAQNTPKTARKRLLSCEDQENISPKRVACQIRLCNNFKTNYQCSKCKKPTCSFCTAEKQFVWQKSEDIHGMYNRIHEMYNRIDGIYNRIYGIYNRIHGMFNRKQNFSINYFFCIFLYTYTINVYSYTYFV